MKLLVVEDDRLIQRSLRQMVEAWGHARDEAADGEQAWEMVRQCRYDLILLDLNLPRLDGLAFCRSSRRVSPMGGRGDGGGDTVSDTFRLLAFSESLLTGFDRITDLVIGSDTNDGPSAVSAASLKDGLGPVATFTFGRGASTRTFLALNDATAGFLATTDALVEITGYAGSLANLAVV